MQAVSGWWAVGQAWKAAHFSAQIECLLLLCTDRPDCVDGRLSFIFYSHLKNMKEIYVTSPVDRKGQAVKGQVSKQLHQLLISSFIRIIALWVPGMTLFLPSFPGLCIPLTKLWINKKSSLGRITHHLDLWLTFLPLILWVLAVGPAFMAETQCSSQLHLRIHIYGLRIGHKC